MSIRVCKCGIEFESKHSTQKYCNSECLAIAKTFSRQDKVEKDYKYRCEKIINSAVFRANKLKVPFDIDSKYLVELWELQHGCCAISGRSFDLRKPEKFRTPRSNAPSLDRIIPIKGYVKGNVRFVCYQVNTALHSFGEEALISLCTDILEFRGWDIR